MVFFPSQWIEPNEYSFCGGCGVNETLMKCHHKDRPACLFCKGSNAHPIDPFYLFQFPMPKYLTWADIKKTLRYILSKNYRLEIKALNDTIKRINKERSDQVHSSLLLHKEREGLARYRRDVLNLPPVYWMKNNGNTRTQVVAKRVDT